ncbi:hypothetical protein CHELA1G11_20720 [Hyphomicrobiales bacterium]|nr:hypothetical protein CHELA1G11_20720 [Hyphomicrobiales bacterium]CAH1691600.1 hypothetical protein CHELA1G2_21035 [Hyphomicrobiales bacterium]
MQGCRRDHQGTEIKAAHVLVVIAMLEVAAVALLLVWLPRFIEQDRCLDPGEARIGGKCQHEAPPR